MISTSVKTADRVFTYPVEFFPNGFHWENYVSALKARPFGIYAFNSVLAAGVSTIISVVLCTFAGFSFAHYRYPGKNLLFLLVLSTIVIPFETIAVPLYSMINSFGLLNTYTGLILPTALFPIGIFIMRQFMYHIPRDLIDAARIDGASELNICFKIVWPLSLPAMSAVAIFTFVTIWNSYLWPLLAVSDDNLRTLPLGMALFENQVTVHYNEIMAVAVTGSIPLVVLFLILQKQFIKGIAMTGLREG